MGSEGNARTSDALSLGPFQLRHPIGQGATAEVWRAEYTPQQTPVAVKILRGLREPDRAALEGFRQEVRSVAGLDHPHIIAILEHGRLPQDLSPDLPQGSPYLVMELAEGGTLSPWCGRLAWAELRAVLLALLSALATAHARGVIHRDLKPGNVLVGGLRPGIKLTDFGLAQIVDGPGGAREVAGTPAYMAPEQFRGDPRALGPWTDLYALGCLGWACVSGAPPFGHQSGLEAWRAHSGAPLPALERAVAAPPGLERWLQRLLEKNPARRFRRAADAAWALEQLDGALLAPTVEPPETDGPPNSRASDRHSPLLGGRATARGPSTGAAPTLDSALGGGTRAWMRTFRWEDPPTAEEVARWTVDAGPESAHPPRPPVPPTWRDAPGEGRAAWTELGAVGLHLFGLRAIPLVDRAAERDALWDALRTVCATGRPHAAVITGAAGHGKSRLAEALGARAHELGVASVLRAWHGPGEGAGAGLGGMLARALRWDGGDLASAQSRAAATLEGWGAPVDPEDVADLAALLAAEPGSARARTPRERDVILRRFLRACCAERPVVLWLDDVAWGLDAIQFVIHLLDVDDSTDLPVLALLTARPESLAERPAEAAALARLQALPGVVPVPLGPLSPVDSEALARSLLGLELDLATQIADHTAGNPLFAVQLVADWVARGGLVPGARGFRLAEGLPLALPDSLTAVWEERLARVLADRSDPDADRIALELAATLGDHVDAVVWAAACAGAGQTPPWGLVEALLEQRLATVDADGLRAGWAFAQSLLRESALAEARRSGRLPEHHRRCAEAISARASADPAHAERLGRHWIAAGALEAALEPLLVAARARQAMGAYGQVEVLLQRRDQALAALGIGPPDPRWVEGELTWVACQVFQGRVDEALPRTEALVAATDGEALRDARVRARLHLAYMTRLRGYYAEALQMLAEIEPEVVLLGQNAACFRLLRERARMLGDLGDLAGATAALQAALRLPPDRRRPDADALAHLDLYRLKTNAGDIAGAWEHNEAALAHYLADGHRWGAADCENNRGELCRAQGRLDQASQHYQISLARFRAIDSYDAVFPLVNLCTVKLQRDEVDGVAASLEAALRLTRRRRAARVEALVIALQVHLAATSERWDAWDRHWEALPRRGQGGPTMDADFASTLLLAGQRAQAAGQNARARAAIEAAAACWQELGRPEQAAQTLAALG